MMLVTDDNDDDDDAYIYGNIIIWNMWHRFFPFGLLFTLMSRAQSCSPHTDRSLTSLAPISHFGHHFRPTSWMWWAMIMK